MRASGEGPENSFGVAVSIPYEGSDVRYGRILEDSGFDVGATWFIVSHWDTPLAWSVIESHRDRTGNPYFSPVDPVTLATFRECHDRGIKTMITLAFSNPLYYPEWLYTPDKPSTCDGEQQWCFYVEPADEPGGVNMYMHEDPDIGQINTTYICAQWLARYMKYCKTLAEYYGDYVEGWQVWEEQNWAPSGSSDEGSCICKSEFFRPYPPYATEEDWRLITRLYAEMLLNVAPLMKRLTPHALTLFGATCGCDTPFIEAVTEEMVALGATQDFFATNIDGYGFHGFRGGVWVSANEKYLGAPEIEVPSPHRYLPDDPNYGRCSMHVHYNSLGAPTMSFLEHVSDLRSRIGALTGQAPDSLELYCTEDGSPFHYNWDCRDQKRGFVRMAKYLGRSYMTCHYADVHISHWQMQEGDAGPQGADYGLVNRTHTNSGCPLTPASPFMLPELKRQAYYTFQAIAGIYNKSLSYIDPSAAGVALYDAPPDEEPMPLDYRSAPEREDLSGGGEEIVMMLHASDGDPSREGSVLISSWRMTDFPLAVGADYSPAPGLTFVDLDEAENPNNLSAYVKIDLSAPELSYDLTVPPEVWQLGTLPQGDLHTLDISCPENLLRCEVDPGNPDGIVIRGATISDYVNVIEIAPAEYPTFDVAGTLDSYLSVNQDGSVSGTLLLAALPFGHSFIDSISVFFEEFDLGASMNDRGEGADAAAGDGIFSAAVSAPGTTPGPPNSLIAEGARHPVVFAAGISQNAMFAGESGSFEVNAYVFDADHPADPAAVASCAARIPGTNLVFPMQRSALAGGIEASRWSASVEFEDLSGVGPELYLVEVVAVDTEGLQSVPWPHIPTGDGTYVEGLYLNLHVKGRGDVWQRCWPELRVR